MPQAFAIGCAQPVASRGSERSSVAGRRYRRRFDGALDLLCGALLLQGLALLLHVALLRRLVGHRDPFPYNAWMVATRARRRRVPRWSGTARRSTRRSARRNG